MGQTLTHGVYLPDEGERNCYNGLAGNWTILDGAVGTIAEHTSALAGKAPLVHTHGKADITDLFNSANTWSGEQTFSQTIQGNAATASAFDTAKSITLTGAVTGTVSGTNSWEITTVLKTGSASTGGTVTNPYFKIASWEVNPNKYFGAILQIQNKCYPQTIGTLIISVRTKTDATFQRGYLLLNNAIGLLPSEFILCYKEVTGKVLCELYYYTTTAYNGIRFSVISEGTGIQNDNSLFNTMVVYQDPTGIAALPSDYTAIQTTIGTYTQDFIPYSNNTYDLGTSTNRWKTLNGINPGALSLPTTDSTKWVDLSGSIVTNGSYTYTPTVDGWISIELKNSNMMAVAIFINQGNIRASCFGNAPQVTGGDFYSSACIPVRANIAVDIYARGNTAVVSSAYFIPCEGNV